MDNTPLFPHKLHLTGGWEDTFIAIIACLLPIFIVSIVLRRRHSQGYDAGNFGAAQAYIIDVSQEEDRAKVNQLSFHSIAVWGRMIGL